MESAVVDASAFFDYLVRSARASAVEGLITSKEIDLHVPSLCDVEIVAALRRGIHLRKMTVERAAEALRSYTELPLSKYGHGALVARALFLRANFTAYDAMYVALAELLGAALLTTDRRLARAVRRHTDLEVLPAD